MTTLNRYKTATALDTLVSFLLVMCRNVLCEIYRVGQKVSPQTLVHVFTKY